MAFIGRFLGLLEIEVLAKTLQSGFINLTLKNNWAENSTHFIRYDLVITLQCIKFLNYGLLIVSVILPFNITGLAYCYKLFLQILMMALIKPYGHMAS